MPKKLSSFIMPPKPRMKRDGGERRVLLIDEDEDEDGVGVELVEFVEKAGEEEAGEEEAGEEEAVCEEADLAFISDDEDDDGSTAIGTPIKDPGVESELDLSSWFELEKRMFGEGTKVPRWDDEDEPKKAKAKAETTPKKIKIKKRDRSKNVSSSPAPPIPVMLGVNAQTPQEPQPTTGDNPDAQNAANTKRMRSGSVHSKPTSLPSSGYTTPIETDDTTPLSPYQSNIDPAFFYDGDLCSQIKARTYPTFIRDNRRVTRPYPGPFRPNLPKPEPGQNVAAYTELYEHAFADQFLERCSVLQDYFVGKQWDWLDNETATANAGIHSEHYYPELGVPELGVPIPDFGPRPITIPAIVHITPNATNDRTRPSKRPPGSRANSPELGAQQGGTLSRSKTYLSNPFGDLTDDDIQIVEDIEFSSVQDITLSDQDDPHKSTPRKILELLTCGQVLTESSDGQFAHEPKLNQREHADARSLRDERRAENALRSFLLVAAYQTDPEIPAAACFIVDDSPHWKKDTTEGRRKKYMAILAMDEPDGCMEDQTVRVWKECIKTFQNMIRQWKWEGKWDNQEERDSLVNECTKVLFDICQYGIESLINMEGESATEAWEQLSSRIDWSQEVSVDSDGKRAMFSPAFPISISEFFDMIKDPNQHLEACMEASLLLDSFEDELVRINRAYELMLFRDGQGKNSENSSYSLPDGVQWTAEDVDTPLPILRLIRKLAQYPESIHHLLQTLSYFLDTYDLSFISLPPSYFSAPSSIPSTAHIDLGVDASFEVDWDTSMSEFTKFLSQSLRFKVADDSIAAHLTSRKWLAHLQYQTPTVHAHVKLCAYLLARGLDPIGTTIKSTHLCCYACSLFFTLVQNYCQCNIDVSITGTTTKFVGNWLFPDMELIWQELDKEAEGGFYIRPGLTRGGELDRRREVLVAWGWVEMDLKREVEIRVGGLVMECLPEREELVVEERVNEGKGEMKDGEEIILEGLTVGGAKARDRKAVVKEVQKTEGVKDEELQELDSPPQRMLSVDELMALEGLDDVDPQTLLSLDELMELMGIPIPETLPTR